MIKQQIKVLVFCLVSLTSYAQRKCGVGEVVSPELSKRYKDLQTFIENRKDISSKTRKITNELIKIPVVVHIIHNRLDNVIGGEGNSNITDEQVYSQIKVLNNDFRKKIGTLGYNTNQVGADMEVEFYLATIDPDGNPTTGINRVYSAKAAFDILGERNVLSNLSYWDSNRYLNIWVTTIADNYIGYGEFPTGEFDGLDLTETSELTDGVFIDHEVFGFKTGTANQGIYQYGRTLTHEVGHWFGLIHTWGDSYCGDDYCADTPPTENSNSSSNCRNKFSTCKGVRTQNMIENYMDYTPDSCMNVFTVNQKERMRQILEISKRRARIVKFAENTLPFVENAELKILSNPSSVDELKFQLLLPTFQDFSLSVFSQTGALINSRNFIDYPSTIISCKDLKIYTAGSYLIQFKTKNTVITKRFIVI